MLLNWVVSFESEAEARSWLSTDSQGLLAKLESSRSEKRPRDLAQLAKTVVDLATMDEEEQTALRQKISEENKKQERREHQIPGKRGTLNKLCGASFG
jgi:hypothetical protein